MIILIIVLLWKDRRLKDGFESFCMILLEIISRMSLRDWYFRREITFWKLYTNRQTEKEKKRDFTNTHITYALCTYIVLRQLNEGREREKKRGANNERERDNKECCAHWKSRLGFERCASLYSLLYRILFVKSWAKRRRSCQLL